MIKGLEKTDDLKEVLHKELGGKLTALEIHVVRALRWIKNNEYGGEHDSLTIKFLPGKMDARIEYSPASYTVDKCDDVVEL